MSKLNTRLIRLEAEATLADSSNSKPTYEELIVKIMEISYTAMHEAACPPDNWVPGTSGMTWIEGEIRRTTDRHATPQFQDYLQRQVEPGWRQSGRTEPFIPPIVGWEYDDWFTPNIVQRRLAIRRRPSIVRLLGETAHCARSRSAHQP